MTNVYFHSLVSSESVAECHAVGPEEGDEGWNHKKERKRSVEKKCRNIFNDKVKDWKNVPQF